MERKIEFIISNEFSGKTVEQFLKSKGFTKQSLVELKKHENNLIIDNKWIFVNHKLNGGEILICNIFEEAISEKITPVCLDFDIVYEDEDILVVDKPYNMPIHPSLNNYENTLANAVAYYNLNKGLNYPFRCINRLDKDTSGLVLIAKHYLSAGILNKMMSKREIKRKYLAIADGDLTKLNEDGAKTIENLKLYNNKNFFYNIDNNLNSGKISLPIGRVDNSTIERFIDLKKGEMAITNYNIIEVKNNRTLVSLNLETGKTHQIRVHLKAIGHPLIGDFLYNPNDNTMNRQALHSHKLSFKHPISGKVLEFISPMPDDMVKAFN